MLSFGNAELGSPLKPSKAGLEDLIDRRGGNGGPLIWPEYTDPEAVAAWRASGPTPSKRNAKLRPPGGTYYRRMTSFIDVLDDKSNLAAWQQRKVLLGLALDPDILAEVRSVEDPDGVDGRRKLDSLAARARDKAEANYRADAGTSRHELTERLDAGEDLGVLPPWIADDIESYRVATGGLEMVSIEQFIVNDHYNVAGTYDRACLYWRNGETDPILVIADLKTGTLVDQGGKFYSAGKLSMQMAGYAAGKLYDPRTFERKPIEHEGLEVSQEVGLLLHMPLNKGETHVYEIPLGHGRNGLENAFMTHLWRSYWGRAANQPKRVDTSSRFV